MIGRLRSEFIEEFSRGAAVLIELDMSAGEHLACGDIHELVRVLPILVAKEDALPPLGRKFALPLVFRNERVCGAAKWVEEGRVNLALLAKEGLVWCSALETLGRAAAHDVGGCLHGVSPEGLGQARLDEHGNRLVDEGLVDALSHAVLLRSVGRRSLVENALLAELGLKCLARVLAAVVRAQELDKVG